MALAAGFSAALAVVFLAAGLEVALADVLAAAFAGVFVAVLAVVFFSIGLAAAFLAAGFSLLCSGMQIPPCSSVWRDLSPIPQIMRHPADDSPTRTTAKRPGVHWERVALLDCFSTELHYTIGCVLFIHKIPSIGELPIHPISMGLLVFSSTLGFCAGILINLFACEAAHSMTVSPSILELRAAADTGTVS